MFSTSVFLSPRPRFHTQSVFVYNFEFAEIFEFKLDSSVSLPPLSQERILRQPPLLSWFDLLLKGNESL
jgi:hypothetical protein